MYASYKIYGYFGENKPRYEKDVKTKTLFSPLGNMLYISKEEKLKDI